MKIEPIINKLLAKSLYGFFVNLYSDIRPQSPRVAVLDKHTPVRLAETIKHELDRIRDRAHKELKDLHIEA